VRSLIQLRSPRRLACSPVNPLIDVSCSPRIDCIGAKSEDGNPIPASPGIVASNMDVPRSMSVRPVESDDTSTAFEILDFIIGSDRNDGVCIDPRMPLNPCGSTNDEARTASERAD